jgi:hypothetical protein
MSSDFFDQIKQWEIAGKLTPQRKVPVFYYDSTSLEATYTASTEKVRKYLPHPDMHPIELQPGRCLVTFSAYENRKTDIDPYNEFSISIMTTFRERQIPALTLLLQGIRRRYTSYVWHLPVSTERAYLGGVELFGYPKFVADISFEKRNDSVACHLSAENNRILTLRGKVLPTRRGELKKIVTYSVKDGVPLVTNNYMNPIEYAESRGSKVAELDIGSGHLICDELKGIQLSTEPLEYHYAPKSQFILFFPRNIIED